MGENQNKIEEQVAPKMPLLFLLLEQKHALKSTEVLLVIRMNFYIADLGNFKESFLSMKLIKRRVISGFRVFLFNNCIDMN